jgi:dolichol-phosphate mannosyltransferase
MLVERNWLIPVLHHEPYLDKPPLLYWLVMASYSLFGVHDWAARLVPSGAAFLTLCTTYLWGRSILGQRGAFLAAMILTLSVRYLYLARMLTMDTLLCLFMVASLAGAHLAVNGPVFRWRWWLLSGVAGGLGMLTKGPVALVLTGVPIVVYLFLDRQAERPRWWAWLAYGMVAIGVAAPWYIAIVLADPSFADYFFWRHNVERFVSPFDHQEPFWFYVPGLLLGMLPWTLLLPGMLHCLGRSDRPAALLFFAPAFLWCVLFFSLAGCKRPGYVLPAMPLLALGLGCYLDSVLPSREDFVGSLARHGSRLAYWATVLTIGFGLAGGMLALHGPVLKPSIGAAIIVFCGFALVYLCRRGWTRGTSVSWIFCATATFLLLLLGMYEVLPGYARRFALRGQVRSQLALGADAKLPVACYPRRWDSISFYLGRDDVRAYTMDERPRLVADLRADSRTLLFVKSNQAFAQLLHDLPASLEFVPHGRQGALRVGIVRARREVPIELDARRP